MKKNIPSQELVKAFLNLKTEEECLKFLNDICTIQELEKLSQRLEAAILLNEGCTYEQVIEKTKISSTTLSRVSRCIRYGDGGYALVIEKIKK